MAEVLKAVRYRNLDEAQKVLDEILDDPETNIFDDGGEEPQGLLSVIPEDRIPEKDFYQLFGTPNGVLIEVELIDYSGYGPPAEEEDYMGFVSEQRAYVVAGCRFEIEISDCPNHARDIHHLEALVMDGLHPLNRWDLAQRLRLRDDWDFEDLIELIGRKVISAQEIDRLIHQGIQ